MPESSFRSKLMEIEVSLIDPSPYQPRRVFDRVEHDKLVRDIGERGVLQPVAVTPNENRYMLIFGHRRLKAAIGAGLTHIPALLTPSIPANPLELALVENLLRQDLGVLEKAEAYMKLKLDGYSQRKIATLAGLSVPSLCGILHLMRIPEDIRTKCCDSGNLGQKFLVNLSRCGSTAQIIDAFDYFSDHGMLPPRKKRKYSKETISRRVLLKCIHETATRLRDSDIKYANGSFLQEELEREVAEFLVILAGKGWFLPKQKNRE